MRITNYYPSTFIFSLLLIGDAESFMSTNTPRGGRIRASSSIMRMSSSSDAVESVVVVSPPGGVGEVTAVESAKLGKQVSWFVVSSQDAKSSGTIALASATLQEIQKKGGSVQIAGANAQALVSEENDARAAVKTWAAQRAASNNDNKNNSNSNNASLVCCLDGVENVFKLDDEEREKGKAEPVVVWTQGVLLAAREAAATAGKRICIVSIDDEMENDTSPDEDEGEGDGFKLDLPKPDLPFGLGGDKEASGYYEGKDLPKSLSRAIKADTKLRYGSLFGIPESSPDFSALVTGPKKNPVLCEEYEQRQVRLDVTSTMKKTAASKSMKFVTCRHVVGEAAALAACQVLPTLPGADITISSMPGIEKFTTWQEELDRVQEQQSQLDRGLVFSQQFGDVPDVARLSQWLCQKWGPAVLTKEYDLAAIRTGARPVYLNQNSDSQVEIVWQKLNKDTYQSEAAGKLLLDIVQEEKGGWTLTATRQNIPLLQKKPLNGEAVLVRRLADAASQATEKGLAKAPAQAKPIKRAPKPKQPMVSSLASVQEVDTTPAAADSGPRQAGVRRSSARPRGTRQRKQQPAVPPNENNDTTTPGSFE
mmetsp:Transcript_408/g.572  ORF Transcript_408/g.572 Transcript_408/m.572 type:complete len:593 (-) Transcript_408:12-1790(-)